MSRFSFEKHTTTAGRPASLGCVYIHFNARASVVYLYSYSWELVKPVTRAGT